MDDWVEVTEEEIEKAIVGFLDQHHKLIEGASGVSVACFQKVAKDYEGKNVAIIICGANMKTEVLKDLLLKYHS